MVATRGRTFKRPWRRSCHLSARGRGPTGVTMADLEDYREAIFNDRLRKDPEKSWDQLVWVWNWSRLEVDGWPAVIIERPSRRVTYVLPWSVFPTSFKHDVDLFLERLSGKDLSEDGPPRPARPSTLQKRAYQLRLAASALIHRGHKADTVHSIADLLSLERYQEILRFFLDRHGGKTSQQVAEMAAFLKDVARHWIKIDSSILEKMKKISSRLSLPRRGMTPKNRERLRPLDDPENVALFLALPQRLRREVDTSKTEFAQQSDPIANGGRDCAVAGCADSAEESHRDRPQEKSHFARHQALLGGSGGGGEKPRADRLRATGGNARHSGLVRPRASAALDQCANRRVIPGSARKCEVIADARSSDFDDSVQIHTT